MKTNDLKNTECGNEMCECKSSQNQESKDSNLTISSSDNKKNEEVLDPTHFGDWQVNCRAIDF
jgi:hypothetical protein